MNRVKIFNKTNLVLLLTVAFFLLMMFLPLLFDSFRSFDDSDLAYTPPAIPVESNAYDTLLKATNELYWPEPQERKLEDLSNNTNWDDAYATDILEKNRACLDLFHQAMQQPDLLVPEPKSYDEELPYLASWKSISLLESIQINSLHRAKNDKAAFDLALETISFGQRIENSGGSLIHYLVGAGIKNITLFRIQDMVADTTLDDTNLCDVIRKLDNFGPNQEGLTNVFKVEYRLQQQAINEIASGWLPDSTNSASERLMISIMIKPLLSTKRTRMEFADGDRYLINNLSKPFAATPWSSQFDSQTNLLTFSRFISGNFMGDLYYQMMETPDESFAKRKSREDVYVTATQLLLALKVYKMRHGQLPDSLSALIPEFFPQVPLDDFDGKPFRYLPDKKIIYSVGPGLKDLGGVGQVRYSPDYNLPFEIKF